MATGQTELPPPLHNVTLNTPDGATQIDHVFLTPYGIFVLETKNMSGWIFGSEKQAQWAQKLYKRTFKLQNPLRQNYKHLKALEAALGVSPDPTAERQCPKYGSVLLIRIVKSGPKAGEQFRGCSAFPKCRVMQSL